MANTPFKVIQGHYFGTNRKPIYDFLLVINRPTITDLQSCTVSKLWLFIYLFNTFGAQRTYVKFSLATGGRFTLTPSPRCK